PNARDPLLPRVRARSGHWPAHNPRPGESRDPPIRARDADKWVPAFAGTRQLADRYRGNLISIVRLLPEHQLQAVTVRVLDGVRGVRRFIWACVTYLTPAISTRRYNRPVWRV